jgi:peptidoglycan glycosyltransferase
LTSTDLLSLTQQWKLDQPRALALRTSAAPTLTLDLSTTLALQSYALGQGQLTVSPLHMALVAATIGNNGFMPAPFVVKDVQALDEQWQPYAAQIEPPAPIIAPATAHAVLEAMHLQGATRGHSGAATSGNRQHAWFIGLAPAVQPQYAIAVLLENTPRAADAEDIGRSVLEELSSE